MKHLILIFVSLMIATSAIASESTCDFDDVECEIAKLTPEENATRLERIKKRDSPKRLKKLESQFSTWSGTHRKLERYIKEQLNDSGSYEHVGTGYSPRLEPMQVGTRFRAKNAFGAMMINDVLAEVSDDGEVIRILKWR